jgi:uncharacterized Zn-binding protein involved in type VI secretion
MTIFSNLILSSTILSSVVVAAPTIAAALAKKDSTNAPSSASSTASCQGENAACQGDITYYSGGLGACGEYVNPDGNGIALPYNFMGSESTALSYCGKTLTIYNPATGESAQGTVMDLCVSCPGRSIDLTPALFNALTRNDLSLGLVSGVDWWFNSPNAAALAKKDSTNAPSSASSTASCQGENAACQGDITYYSGGLGACGEYVNPDGNGIALPYNFMGSESTALSYCGKTLTIYNPATGESAQGTVMDLCYTCPGRSIDLTPALFNALTRNDLSLGLVSGVDWWFNSVAGSTQELVI